MPIRRSTAGWARRCVTWGPTCTCPCAKFPQPDCPSGSDADFAKTAGVLLPALSVDAPLAVVRQSEVPQGKDRRTLVGRQRDLDGSRPGRNRRMALPAPGHDEAPGRFDLSIMTSRNV